MKECCDVLWNGKVHFNIKLGQYVPDPTSDPAGSGSQPDPTTLDPAGSGSLPDPPNLPDIRPDPDPDPVHPYLKGKL